MTIEDGWVLLRTFPDRAQATLFAEFLENQGVTVSIEGAYSAGVLPGVEYVRVMVPTARLHDAEAAASAFDGPATPAAAEP